MKYKHKIEAELIISNMPNGTTKKDKLELIQRYCKWISSAKIGGSFTGNIEIKIKIPKKVK